MVANLSYPGMRTASTWDVEQFRVEALSDLFQHDRVLLVACF